MSDKLKLRVKLDDILQQVSNLTTEWNEQPSNTKYPSEKLVKDTIDELNYEKTTVSSTSQTTPNITLYDYTKNVTEYTLNLQSAEIETDMLNYGLTIEVEFEDSDFGLLAFQNPSLEAIQNPSDENEQSQEETDTPITFVYDGEKIYSTTDPLNVEQSIKPSPSNIICECPRFTIKFTYDSEKECMVVQYGDVTIYSEAIMTGIAIFGQHSFTSYIKKPKNIGSIIEQYLQGKTLVETTNITSSTPLNGETLPFTRYTLVNNELTDFEIQFHLHNGGYGDILSEGYEMSFGCDGSDIYRVNIDINNGEVTWGDLIQEGTDITIISKYNEGEDSYELQAGEFSMTSFYPIEAWIIVGANATCEAYVQQSRINEVVTTWSTPLTDNKVPSEKLTKETIDNVIYEQIILNDSSNISQTINTSFNEVPLTLSLISTGLSKYSEYTDEYGFETTFTFQNNYDCVYLNGYDYLIMYYDNTIYYIDYWDYEILESYYLSDLQEQQIIGYGNTIKIKYTHVSHGIYECRYTLNGEEDTLAYIDNINNLLISPSTTYEIITKKPVYPTESRINKISTENFIKNIGEETELNLEAEYAQQTIGENEYDIYSYPLSSDLTNFFIRVSCEDSENIVAIGDAFYIYKNSNIYHANFDGENFNAQGNPIRDYSSDIDVKMVRLGEYGYQYTIFEDTFSFPYPLPGIIILGSHSLDAWSDISKIDILNESLNSKENISNKVTTLSSSSTDTQYPSAKAVYDNYIQKSSTSGLIKNDGTIDTNAYATTSSVSTSLSNLSSGFDSALTGAISTVNNRISNLTTSNILSSGESLNNIGSYNGTVQQSTINSGINTQLGTINTKISSVESTVANNKHIIEATRTVESSRTNLTINLSYLATITDPSVDFSSLYVKLPNDIASTTNGVRFIIKYNKGNSTFQTQQLYDISGSSAIKENVLSSNEIIIIGWDSNKLKLLKILGKEYSTVAETGSYNDLTNKPTIPTVPTNVSAFTNDSGYLTSHQSLKTINNETLVGTGNITVSTNVEVDDEWVENSENPVQSKVIQSELNNKADTIHIQPPLVKKTHIITAESYYYHGSNTVYDWGEVFGEDWSIKIDMNNVGNNESVFLANMGIVLTGDGEDNIQINDFDIAYEIIWDEEYESEVGQMFPNTCLLEIYPNKNNTLTFDCYSSGELLTSVNFIPHNSNRSYIFEAIQTNGHSYINSIQFISTYYLSSVSEEEIYPLDSSYSLPTGSSYLNGLGECIYEITFEDNGDTCGIHQIGDFTYDGSKVTLNYQGSDVVVSNSNVCTIRIIFFDDVNFIFFDFFGVANGFTDEGFDMFYTDLPVENFKVTYIKNALMGFDQLNSMLNNVEYTGNKVSSWSYYVTDTNYPSEKLVKDSLNLKADITALPTKTSDLTNDSGYLTSHQSLIDYVQKSSTVGLLKNDGSVMTSGTGSTNYASGNHTHSNYVNPTIADNLTTNDATQVLSAKQGKILSDMIGSAIQYIQQ